MDNGQAPRSDCVQEWEASVILHDELAKAYDFTRPHQLRASFWSLVPPGQYSATESQELILQYRKAVEKQMAEELSQHSIAYWLHAYRRLAPFAAGEQDSPATINITRGIMEAAFQKYGLMDPCGGIAWSNEVPDSEIVGGLLMSPKLDALRSALRHTPQLVLTRFGPAELEQLYRCEKLAFEMWRCGAAYIGSRASAPLIVDHTPASLLR